MLIVNSLSKSYGKLNVLEDINLEFTNGIYSILAPNGAGKTSLIKMLTTLTFPSKGEILFDGTDIIKLDEKYREILGYLPQEFGYYKSYTPRKYLLYIAALKGINKNIAEKEVLKVLKLVALEAVINKKMKKLSVGMIQRVGIAQALLGDPKIIIFDEPTAGLDPKERVRFRNLLSDLSNDRIIIISTHIVSDIEFISKEVIMLKNDKILCKDTPKNLCNNLKGRVYETTINVEDAIDFREEHIALSEKQEDGVMKIRFIGEGSATCEEVTPNLEDVFLYVYN